jgi:hypothetical protein
MNDENLEQKRNEEGYGIECVAVGGVRWNQTGPVLVDYSREFDYLEARIKWPHDCILIDDHGTRKPIDYFKKAFPMSFLRNIVLHTNRFLQYGVPISESEMLTWLGIRIGMTLECGKGGWESFFQTTAPGFTRPGNYTERTGMKKIRFKSILDALHLDTPQEVTNQPVINQNKTFYSNINISF